MSNSYSILVYSASSRIVALRGRRTARSSNWAILLFSDIKFNNIIITTNNYIYPFKIKLHNATSYCT